MEYVEVKELGEQALDRKGKLLRWSGLVRASHNHIRLFDMLETWSEYDLQNTKCTGQYSALCIAAQDPVFNAAGLSPDASIRDAMNFFDIDQEQLHMFSCNCGGAIGPKEQASYIAELAG